MRTILIKNKFILKNLKEKDELSKRIIEISEESKKLEEEYNKIIARLSRLDEKTKPEIRRVNKDIEKGEFEQLSRVFLKDGDVYFEIVDRLEEFKESFKKQNASSKK